MTGCCREADVEIVLNIPDTFNVIHSKDDKNTGLLFTRVGYYSLLHQSLLNVVYLRVCGCFCSYSGVARLYLVVRVFTS